METYFWIISVIFLLAGLLALPALINIHQNNKQLINLERMDSREIAEALVGKKIDWDN